MVISNSFNNFVCSVAPNIKSTIKQTFKPFWYLTNPCVDSFLISPCTKKEFLEILSNFDNNKAAGLNTVPLKSLKSVKEPIAKDLCSIYNLSFTTEFFGDSV